MMASQLLGTRGGRSRQQVVQFGGVEQTSEASASSTSLHLSRTLVRNCIRGFPGTSCSLRNSTRVSLPVPESEAPTSGLATLGDT